MIGTALLCRSAAVCAITAVHSPCSSRERVGLGFLFLCNCMHAIARLHQLRLWVVHLKCEFCKRFPLLCLASNILFWPVGILRMYFGECISVQIGDVRYPPVQTPTCSSQQSCLRQCTEAAAEQTELWGHQVCVCPTMAWLVKRVENQEQILVQKTYLRWWKSGPGWEKILPFSTYVLLRALWLQSISAMWVCQSGEQGTHGSCPLQITWLSL